MSMEITEDSKERRQEMTRKIKNFTPHQILIFRKEDCEFSQPHRKLFLKKGASPILVLPSEGILNAQISYQQIGDDPPIFLPITKSCDLLPEGDDYIVVSALFVSAMKILRQDTSRLLTVSQAVYENPENPRPIGCLGFNLNP